MLSYRYRYRYRDGLYRNTNLMGGWGDDWIVVLSSQFVVSSVTRQVEYREDGPSSILAKECILSSFAHALCIVTLLPSNVCLL